MFEEMGVQKGTISALQLSSECSCGLVLTIFACTWHLPVVNNEILSGYVTSNLTSVIYVLEDLKNDICNPVFFLLKW